MTIKLTKNRQKILDLLQSTEEALSAADIHARATDMDLATVYRTLDLFVKEKLIKQIHLKSGEALFEYQAKPHHHALCSECERVIHFTAPDEKIKQLLKIDDFDVDEIEVTVKGICRHN
jgi:Fur family ferric uptake transcriptional regulator/Fur family peroxide stress response transcriptional regulator